VQRYKARGCNLPKVPRGVLVQVPFEVHIRYEQEAEAEIAQSGRYADMVSSF